MFVFAHVSDIHIDGTRRSAARARTVMSYLDAFPGDLDAILVTGDVAGNGLPAEYVGARTLLTSRHPVLALPGNQDVRGLFRAGLLGDAGGVDSDAPINRVYRSANATYVLCDWLSPGRVDEPPTDETLTWLSSILDASTGASPVFVAFHHPPVELGAPDAEPVRRFHADRLAEVVADRPDVVAFLCGHAHAPVATTFAGRPLIVAPGVVSGARLPWEHPVGDVSVDRTIPPALAFHVLDDAGRLTTHYRVLR
ncbi:metallophosphoesterase [Embleya hyalina]|uniref:3',5'-cyclic adenosine monophosphate phosphodiesterase CpdA n=1 Tax=Embleya hyalina TaxID=516124 RepID=A0A401YQU3_9ACTN|nr:metallophosphoesterase [Embleya hyalina]GCD96961.1 3',5'-cyclic adenosine monophosphate phosphodiesterase CpdA [Embleya hyalina]